MAKQTDVTVKDVTGGSSVQIVLGNSYTIYGSGLSSFQKLTQDRVLLLTLAVLIFALAWPAFGPPVQIREDIDPSYVHLGDNVFNPKYCQETLGDVPVALVPIGLAYINFFDTYHIRSIHGVPRDAQLVNADLELYANEVDNTSPITISINGESIGALNQYFLANDSCRRKFVRMSIPLSVMAEGNNVVSIEVGMKASPSTESEYEDMEFDHLGIALYFRRELSAGAISGTRIYILAASALAFFLMGIGPRIRSAFQDDAWRVLATVVSLVCLVLTVTTPF